MASNGEARESAAYVLISTTGGWRLRSSEISNGNACHEVNRTRLVHIQRRSPKRSIGSDSAQQSACSKVKTQTLYTDTQALLRTVQSLRSRRTDHCTSSLRRCANTLVQRRNRRRYPALRVERRCRTMEDRRQRCHPRVMRGDER